MYQYATPMQGFTAPNRPQPRNTQPVTPEMSKMVLQNSDELSVKITPVDKIKNMCTHKYPGNGQIALTEDGNGKYTCRVCGESFRMIMDPTAEIYEVTERMLDILQSAKTLYLDIPEDFAKEYFQIITLLKRSPQVLEKAHKNFIQYDQYAQNPMAVYPGVSSFQQVNGMIGSFNMGGIQPGYYGYPPQPGGYAPQPGYGYPTNGYGQPYPPQPGTPGYDNGNPLMYGGAVPQAPAPTGPAAPAAPAPAPGTPPAAPADGEVSQTKSFSV